MEIPQVIFLIKQNQIITMVESQNVEYKESWRDEYLKWICGFANAQGGRIYIGIRDDGSVNGVPDAARLLEDIPNKIRNSMGILADVNLLNREGKNVVEIIVPPVAYPSVMLPPDPKSEPEVFWRPPDLRSLPLP